MKISYLATHHSGGYKNDYLASTKHLTWQDINEAHRQRWNFKSSLGLYGGYNFFISAGGEVKQFRKIGEETAAQIGFNSNTISICFAGNFIRVDEKPTEAQKTAFKNLWSKIKNKDWSGIAIIPNTEIDIKEIHQHRWFQKGTECDCLPSNYWSDMVAETKNKDVISLLRVLVAMKIISADFLKIIPFLGSKLGSKDRGCEGYAD